MRTRAMVPLVVLVLSMAGTSACSDCDVGHQEPIDYAEGTTEDGYYETTGWNEEWLHFPQGRTYRLHHGLGTERYVVTLYLSFDPQPFETDGAAESSGNIGILEDVDPEYFQIRNDTCAEMYVRAVAVEGAGSG